MSLRLSNSIVYINFEKSFDKQIEKFFIPIGGFVVCDARTLQTLEFAKTRLVLIDISKIIPNLDHISIKNSKKQTFLS